MSVEGEGQLWGDGRSEERETNTRIVRVACGAARSRPQGEDGVRESEQDCRVGHEASLHIRQASVSLIRSVKRRD